MLHPQAFCRIKREVKQLLTAPHPGIFVDPDDNDIRVVHTLVEGPANTPYEGGFFYFLFRYSNDYPFSPPSVKLMTTGNGQVSFHPNINGNGDVSLSILDKDEIGHCSWNPALTLSSVFLFIKSLMAGIPLSDKPDQENVSSLENSQVVNYSDIIRYQTIRALKDKMRKKFPSYIGSYKRTIRIGSRLEGTALSDPFGGIQGVFHYKDLDGRLKAIIDRIPVKVVQMSGRGVYLEMTETEAGPNGEHPVSENQFTRKRVSLSKWLKDKKLWSVDSQVTQK